MYEAPKLTDLGTLAELTLDDVYKDRGTGDVLHIAGEPPISIPGGHVTSAS